MMKWLTFFALLLGSASMAAAQTASHLDPGKVNIDCANCQQMEQEQPDQRIPPNVAPRMTDKFAFFLSTLRVTNTDSRKIKQVTWQCTFIHSASGETIATYTFLDKRKISAGRTMLFTKAVLIPMSKLVSHPRVVKANTVPDPNSEHPKVRQVITLKEIKYADGSAKTP